MPCEFDEFLVCSSFGWDATSVVMVLVGVVLLLVVVVRWVRRGS